LSAVILAEAAAFMPMLMAMVVSGLASTGVGVQAEMAMAKARKMVIKRMGFMVSPL
jgi:hypothetical protein